MCLLSPALAMVVPAAPAPARELAGPVPRQTADSGGHIGIQLLDIPTSKRDDPRAQTYIVDHLNPGQTIQRRVRVSNHSPTSRTVELYPAAVTITDDGFTFADGRTPNELTTWITVERGSLDLASDATQTIAVTIAVPPDASQGERYAVIWAQTDISSAVQNITQLSRVGVRVYLDVGPGGEPPSSFEITRLTADRTPEGVPRLTAQVHNTGARTLDISGTLTLSDGPASTSAGPFQVTAATTLAAGHTAPVTVLLDPRLPAGPWQAHLTLVSGLIRQEISATITFPAGPGRSVKPVSRSWLRPATLGLALVILALTALGYYIRRRRSRVQRRAAANQM